MNERREMEVFFTVQHGERWSVALTEEKAQADLHDELENADDTSGWSIERSREIVAVATGSLYEGGGGVAIDLTEVGGEVIETSQAAYVPVHVFWQCPLCGRQHNNSLYADPVRRCSPESNPALWYCEHGHGLVFVSW